MAEGSAGKQHLFAAGQYTFCRRPHRPCRPIYIVSHRYEIEPHYTWLTSEVQFSLNMGNKWCSMKKKLLNIIRFLPLFNERKLIKVIEHHLLLCCPNTTPFLLKVDSLNQINSFIYFIRSVPNTSFSKILILGHSMSDHQAPDLIVRTHPNFCTKLQVWANY